MSSAEDAGLTIAGIMAAADLERMVEQIPADSDHPAAIAFRAHAKALIDCLHGEIELNGYEIEEHGSALEALLRDAAKENGEILERIGKATRPRYN